MRRVSMPSALFSAPDFKHRNPDFRNCNAKIGIITYAAMKLTDLLKWGKLSDYQMF